MGQPSNPVASTQLAPQVGVGHTFSVVVGGGWVGQEVWKHVTEGGVIHWQIGIPHGSCSSGEA